MKIKHLLFGLLILFLISCKKEDEYCYSFDVWISDTNYVRVDYYANVGGYTLLVGCEPNLTLETATIIKEEPERMSGGWAFTRICTPTYVKIISLAGTEEKKI